MVERTVSNGEAVGSIPSFSNLFVPLMAWFGLLAASILIGSSATKHQKMPLIHAYNVLLLCSGLGRQCNSYSQAEQNKFWGLFSYRISPKRRSQKVKPSPDLPHWVLICFSWLFTCRAAYSEVFSAKLCACRLESCMLTRKSKKCNFHLFSFFVNESMLLCMCFLRD